VVGGWREKTHRWMMNQLIWHRSTFTADPSVRLVFSTQLIVHIPMFPSNLRLQRGPW
jgi:hypothetical protein